MAEAQPAAGRRRGLTLTQLAWLTPLTAIVIALRRPTQDNSYLWHVEAGVRQIEAKAVLTADPFTFTAGGQPWRTQSWLVELLYGWLERFGELFSAPVVVGISGALMLTAVGLRVGRHRGVLGPLATVWVMWLTLGYFTARPVFPSLAIFAVLTLVADRPRLRWTIPLLFWVWASVHGGFFIGLGYLVLQGLRLRDRRYFIDATVGAVAATFTAHGIGVWEILVSFAGSSQNLDIIAEWQRPDFVSLALFPFLLGLVALLVVAMARKLEWRDLWMVIPFMLFAFTANRSVPLAAIAIVPFVFPTGHYRLGQMPFSKALSVVVAAFIVLAAFFAPLEDDLFENRFPVAASAHLDAVRTFHDDSSGGYFIYTGFPYIFVDDRAELLGQVYIDFARARGGHPVWRDLFERYQLQQALLKPEDPLVGLLEGEGWSERYADDQFVVLRPATD